MEAMEIMSPGQSAAVMHQITQAEVDMQVSTAKRYPRSLDTCLKDAKTMATKTREIAQGCFFVLPRGGKSIIGPSVRLAEILASTWGNIRAESRIVEESDRHITAQATVWDMQTNVLVRTEVRRRITNRDGRRYNDDMINTTANAATSIALRNALFRVVPRSVIDEVFEEARRVAVGDQRTLDERRQRMVDSFIQMGIPAERVLARIDRQAVVEVTLKDLETLIGVFNAIRDGELSIDEAFPQEDQVNGNGGKKNEAEPAATRQSRTAQAMAAISGNGGQDQAEQHLSDLEADSKEAGVSVEIWKDWLIQCDITKDGRTHTKPRLEKLANFLAEYIRSTPTDEVSDDDRVASNVVAELLADMAAEKVPTKTMQDWMRRSGLDPKVADTHTRGRVNEVRANLDDWIHGGRE